MYLFIYLFIYLNEQSVYCIRMYHHSWTKRPNELNTNSCPALMHSDKCTDNAADVAYNTANMLINQCL